ncbi:MAG: hypothetical protein IJP61_06270 [Treponema sp.]|nr:hypothetical protein [Treponema sp.]
MYYFLVNLKGGSGKSVRRWRVIKSLLEKNKINYELLVPEFQGDASRIAAEVCQKEDDDIRLVILGGDGTINEVLNGITDFSKLKIGLIPTGSGNDFSRGLGLPRHRPRKSLRMILAAKEGKKIDVGMVESDDGGDGPKKKFFAISSGFGLDAIVGTSINTSKIKIVLNKLHAGKLSYAILTVITLFKMTTHRVSVSFDGEKPMSFDKLIFLAAMNTKAEGGGVPMNPKAVCTDGKLSVCIAAGVPKWKTFLMFPLLCLGLHGKLNGFFLRDFKKMELLSETPSVIHTDGEFFGNLKKATFSVLESKMTMLV